MAEPKLSWREKYQSSPRFKSNRNIRSDIQRAVGADWADAFERCLVTRGRRIGLLRSAAPVDDRARVIWNAYRDTILEHNAAEHRCFPNRSYQSSIGAVWLCREPDATAAYQATQAAINAEIARKGK